MAVMMIASTPAPIALLEMCFTSSFFGRPILGSMAVLCDLSVDRHPYCTTLGAAAARPMALAYAGSRCICPCWTGGGGGACWSLATWFSTPGAGCSCSWSLGDLFCLFLLRLLHPLNPTLTFQDRASPLMPFLEIPF